MVTLVVDRHVPTVMRDGAVLRADVYRPAEGRWPTLVHRIPYGKDNPMGVTNLMLHPVVAAERGFAVVVQDTRGRFASAGSWDPLRCEADDGYDTVEWAAAQNWSTGRIGIYGSSYMGVTALQAVASAPPHLHGAAAYLTGGNYADGWVYSGGALELLFNLRWAAGQALAEVARSPLQGAEHEAAVARLRWIAADPLVAMRTTPLAEVFGPADPLVPYWREWLAHPTYDDYWRAVDLTRSLVGTRIPVLTIAGWYDGFLKGQLDVHRTLVEQGPAGASVPHETVMGPWDHESYQGMRPNAAGDEFFGLDAVSGTAGLSGRVLDWFDHWLRTDDDAPRAGSAATPSAAGTASRTDHAPVRFFHMRAGGWSDANAWPPTEATTTTLYLRSGGRANGRHGDGVLADAPGSQHAVDTFVHDPRDPVPTRGGRHLGYFYGRAGVQDQAALELRDDVLVYTSPRLVAPLDVLGAVRAKLYLVSSADSTDLAVKLVDVRPEGYCANVAEGVARLPAGTDGLAGGAPALVEVDCWDTAYRFDVGHRVRIEVASSNFPRFDRNGGLPAVPATTAEEDWVTATQQIHAGPDHPSRIHLGGSRP